MRRTSFFVLLLAASSGMASAQTPATPTAGASPQAVTGAASDGSSGNPTNAPAVPPSSGAATVAAADEPPQKEEEATLVPVAGSKALGMSILGNQEAPTSLVIVPWKTSELGSSMGVSTLLDDSRQPVDKDVFVRSLRYYEISSGTAHQDGATGAGQRGAAAGIDAAQSVAASPRRK